MRCDSCGKTLEYRERVVSLKREGDKMKAVYTVEGPALPSEEQEVESKHHEACYRLLRARDSSLPEPE